MSRHLETLIFLTFSVIGPCLASFHIQENGDTIYYEGTPVTFEVASEVCSSLHGSLPQIKLTKERLLYSNLIDSRKGSRGTNGFWVGAEYSVNGFIWTVDQSPVEAGNVVEVAYQGCDAGCCRLELTNAHSSLKPIPCTDSDYRTGFLCVIKNTESAMERKNRRVIWPTSDNVSDKIKNLEGKLIDLQASTQIEIKSLKEDIKSLKTTRIVLFSLVCLSLILIILLTVGIVISYKKAKVFIIGKIRDILAVLGDRVDGMTRKLEKSLDKHSSSRKTSSHKTSKRMSQ